MQGFGILTLLVFVIGLELVLNKVRRRKIEEEITSMGGEVMNIERRNFLSGTGPFVLVGRGRAVYKIEYYLGGETKEGWVKFGRIYGPDWKL